MQSAKRSIAGSLNALFVLEAAVRSSGFSQAARELNLSQPAVSRHIATLEARLGCKLFHRDHNRITPTGAGQKLADAVALGLTHIDTVWRELSLYSGDHAVVLACSYGFADQWLLPRFEDLRKAMAGTQIRIVTSDRFEDVDFRKIDAAVVWDVARTADRPFIPLIKDETFPICTPGFLKDHPQLPADNAPFLLDFARLQPSDYLHFSVGDSGFLTWQGWFTKAGLSVPEFSQPPSYTAYPFLMQAVLNGEGLALGWRGLVDGLLKRGDIVRAGPSVSSRAVSYYLQFRQTVDENPAMRCLVDWFQNEVAEG